MNSYASLCEMAEDLSRRGSASAVVAFGERGEERRSYAALARDISRLAAGLVEAGLAPGAPVLLCAPNSPAWIIAYFAILRAGGLVVPLDDQSSDRELARVVGDCGAQRVFTARHHLAAFQALEKAGPMEIALLDGEGEGSRVKSWPQLLSDRSVALPEIDPDGFACLLYTSGTTGTPKAVPLSHRNILANIQALVASKLAGPGDRVLLPLPLHHAYPCTVGLLGTLASGAAVVLPAGVSGPQLVAALRASKATILIGVPRLYTALLAGIDAKVSKLGSTARIVFHVLLALALLLRRRLGLRVGRLIFAGLHRNLAPALRILGCGGARLDPEAAWKLEALGWEVLTGYGLTETSPLLTFSPRGRGRADTAGIALPGVDLRIDMQPGKTFGEILARGPSVFAGYRNNPEATRQAFTAEGWFRSGDVGFVDADGYLHIVGRAKEIIVLPGGKNIQPEDVETAYAASPMIRDAAVFEHGGALTGLLVPDDEAIRARGTASVRNLLRDAVEEVSLRLPSYQRLSGYRLTRETLPRTHLGKLRRHLLHDIYERAERGSVPTAAAPLSAADRELLAAQPAAGVWAWLAERFPDRPLTLDTSPQLDLQIDSLEWVELSFELEEQLGIALTGEAIAQIVTLRDLLLAVNAAADGAGRRAPAAAPRTEDVRWLRPLGPLLAILSRAAYAFNRLVVRLVFRLRVEGAESLPPEAAYILTPNHVSFLDPFVVAAALPPQLLKNVYWAGWTGMLFAGPLSRLLSRVTRVFPVDPDRSPASSLALGQKVLEDAHILVWFPEGRRAPSGELGPFHPGVGLLLQRAGVAAVPTLISGTYEALPRGRWLPRLGQVTVAFGAAQGAEELAALGEGADAQTRIADGLRRAVAELGSRDGRRSE